MIQPARIRILKDLPMRSGRFVLYWMQASQRAHCNHALEFAIDLANEVSVPLVVLFGITDAYPEANARHYAFMLQGLAELRRDLEDRGIMFVLRIAPPEVAACELAEDACALITDRGYTRIQKRWREYVAEHALCRVIQVETDVVVPVEAASGKEEYAARTLRPRIHRLLPEYLVPLKARKLRKGFPDFDLASEDLSAPEELLARLDIDRSVPPVSAFRGGHSHAVTLLREFIDHKLDHYDELSNDPSLDFTSHLSPYLHFGQISPLEIALAVAQSPGPNEEAFLEQLIVRRELSMNFVQYNLAYDSYDCLPDWAQATLAEHAKDPRPYVYSEDELGQAQTHDPYWNAAQLEMVRGGKMHNYMRMYWGKKILEWSPTPREAFDTALRLNNRYELDGRDPNGFTGVAWCFGKHDRPWQERPVFGKVRYMNAAGLERKFKMDAYLAKVAALGQ